MPPLKLLYITSRGHSGSTLLDLIISSHSQVVSVGEVKCLSSAPNDHCTCGAMRIWECPFWERVDEALYYDTRLRLGDLDIESADNAMFARHNTALFRAVSDVTGKNIIVDSSKTIARLRSLINAGIFDLTIVHLMRSPYGVVYSNLKRGRDWKYHARNYTVGMISTRRILADQPHLTVRYENLARDAAGVVTPIMEQLGLDFEPAQLQWAGGEHHNIGGNLMRFTTDSTIRIDASWKKKLTLWQKLFIWWCTMPTRREGTDFYDRHRHWFDGTGFLAALRRTRALWRARLRRARAGKKLRAA